MAILDKDEVFKMAKLFKKPVTSFMLRTTNAIMDELCSDGKLVYIGEKFDRAQMSLVKKYTRPGITVED